MLLSLEKNFIFIHIPKTAGTSITRALRPWCLKPKPTQWRRLLSRLPVPEAPVRINFRQHDRAAWLRRKLPAHLYAGAYKFAVVRNPFELVVSNYQHLRRKTSRRRHRQAQRWDFKAFLRYLERKNRLARVDQTSWISDRDGKLIVDEVLRFETLAEQFNVLAERLGLPGELPRLNVGAPVDYRALYDEEAKAIVRRLYLRDFERFGYEF
ncbi:sulfotransferase family protein [Mesorhizobium sp. WSM4303]|uniref:sulfotransferase family 2 domain-containing protein n=1 Tax=unclassified Mesorhizobium TaxID=325217 RepID=UPI00115CE983|nr:MULTISPECIES: sulfotransferase family 2 domain-containing protein [unclassified Mesorhizobium]TRC97162.1 sulfotransferase family protein [Mesorhizobium sp. WSM4306]TRD05404.1 sulfotransferase family protein [Mesorhizobium sp. WSM4303]